MEIVAGSLPHGVSRIGILAGAFNPPTVAHLALVEAARQALDAVICVVPRTYPHKTFHGATLEQRLDMLRALDLTAAITDGGLFLNIAREIRRDLALPPNAELHFICGRDAAERIINWDYGDLEPIDAQLNEFHLLVAARNGDCQSERRGVRTLALDGAFDEISSTVIREALAGRSGDWEHLAPFPIREMVRAIYGTMEEP